MSEPVGNGPRTPDIPSNSHKARKPEKAEIPTDAPPKLEKAIEGKVVRLKTPWWKRAAGSIVAEDAGTVGDYILTDVVIPAAKNLIRDIIVGGIDRTLYGGNSRGLARRGSTIVGSPGGSSLKTQYRDVPPERPRVLSSSARSTHRFEDIVLETRDDALNVIAQLVNQVEEFGTASVGDLYDILGESADWTDTKWGWRDLREANLQQTRGGWRLILPPTEPLNKQR